MRRTMILLTVLALLALPTAGLAAEAVPTETYSTLLTQIDGNRVAVAHVNEQTHHVKVTLGDGTTQVVDFPPTDHKRLIDTLLHHGVTPIYTAPVHVAKPVHHVLRYVAAGVVVVLLLIGIGVWVYTRGQRQPPAASDGSTPGAPGVADTPDRPNA